MISTIQRTVLALAMFKFSAVLVAASFSEISRELAIECKVTRTIFDESELIEMFGKNKNRKAPVAHNMQEIERADDGVSKNFTKTFGAKDLIEEINSQEKKSSEYLICAEFDDHIYGSKIKSKILLAN